MQRNRFPLTFPLAATLAAALAAALPSFAEFLELAPGKTGAFDYVASPTPRLVAEMRAAGKRPFVEDTAFGDEAAAFTNWAENASAVAFLQMPRRHLLHTWRLLGVKLLKTVRFDPEGSAGRFRREASFKAFQNGADGIWLPDADRLPPGWQEALAAAREDWRVLLYLQSLAEEAESSPDPAVRIEQRRVAYWFGWMPADWENADTLLLECVAWARRLEQLLGKPRASLPEKRAKVTQPQTIPFMPYFGAPVKPVQEQMKKLGDTVYFDGGLSFKADAEGFSLTYSVTNGPTLQRGRQPGGTLDFRVYIPGDVPGSFLPYRFHCDLDPAWYAAVRAPATGREGFLFGTDERFRPFSIAYSAHNRRIWTWPVLRDFGPDYPDPNPSLTVSGNKVGGWSATVSVKWIHLFGNWPLQKAGKNDVWFVGLEKSPETGLPLSGRVLWPRGHADFFRTLASRMKPWDMTSVYSRELERTEKVWTTHYEERLYPYARTREPSFSRYDRESDAMFWTRLVEPLCISNENAWSVIWMDKDHPSKFPSQPEKIKMAIWEKFNRMIFLSHIVGLRRLDYLEGRFAGREPPPAPPKRKTAEEIAADHKGPDIDYDPDALDLDEKEF